MKSFSGDGQPDLRKAIRSDADNVWRAGKGHGELLTAKNALKVVQNGAQSGVPERLSRASDRFKAAQIRFGSAEKGIYVLDGLQGRSLRLPPSGRNVVGGKSRA
jgi:hypothetical protein